jgi:hypothetical protein
LTTGFAAANRASIDPRSATIEETKDAARRCGKTSTRCPSPRDVVGSRRKGIDNAEDDVRIALEGLDEDQTLREALEGLRPELEALADAFQGFVETDDLRLRDTRHCD